MLRVIARTTQSLLRLDDSMQISFHELRDDIHLRHASDRQAQREGAGGRRAAETTGADLGYGHIHHQNVGTQGAGYEPI